MQHTYTKNGFTLVETLVVIGIFTLVSLTTTSAIITFYRANSFAIEQSFAVSEASRGITVLVRDIREAIYSDEGSYPIISIATSSFDFYSDTDNDDSVELIRYYIEGDSLFIGTTNATTSDPVYNPLDETLQVMSSEVRNWSQDTAVFRYFDDTGTEILDFNNVIDVAFVEITLIVNINPFRAPNEFTLRSSATLRNLKTNL